MKLSAQYGNSHSVEKVLLHNKNIKQTIRLCLGGAFDLTNKHITQQLKTLHENCPRLFEKFLPAAEQPTSEDSEYSNDILSTLNHHQPRATRYVARNMIRETLSLPVTPKDLEDIRRMSGGV
jgi:hypothetical protein